MHTDQQHDLRREHSMADEGGRAGAFMEREQWPSHGGRVWRFAAIGAVFALGAAVAALFYSRKR